MILRGLTRMMLPTETELMDDMRSRSYSSEANKLMSMRLYARMLKKVGVLIICGKVGVQDETLP